MTNRIQYDAAVIGAGQGGVPLAMALAHAGRKTALIEREHVGGTCVNEGCTPTKTMIASARVSYLTNRSQDYGINTEQTAVYMKEIRKRKRDIVESFRNGSLKRIQDTEGLDFYMGTASFSGKKELYIDMNDGQPVSLTAENIFINTGARPSVPDIKGIDSVGFLDSTSIMELDTVPEHLIIIGGGYIGLEFGQMFRRFGSRVTIIHRGPQLLMREDPDIAEEVRKVLTGDGIEVLLNTNPVAVSGDLSLQVTVSAKPEETNQGKAITGSHLLAAAGRVPATDILHPEKSGIETDNRGFIRVNERLETNVEGIFAIGDVKGGPAFTHISYDDYRIVFANLMEGGKRTIHDRPVPYTLFTDPQLGRVGLSEKEARAAGKNIRVAKMPMNWVARALETDESRGLMKAVVDANTDRILGAAVLGIEGGEIMAMLQVAMMGGLPYTALRDAVFAHPTLAESLNNIFFSFED